MPFEKHSSDPSAFVDGKFVAPVGATVFAWRFRSGTKPAWHKCTVVKVSDQHVELWDDVLDQWFCFDVSWKELPDVRISP